MKELVQIREALELALQTIAIHSERLGIALDEEGNSEPQFAIEATYLSDKIHDAIDSVNKLEEKLNKKFDVEKIGAAMWNIVPAHCDMTYNECKKLFPNHSSTRMYDTLARAATIEVERQQEGQNDSNI